MTKIIKLRTSITPFLKAIDNYEVVCNANTLKANNIDFNANELQQAWWLLGTKGCHLCDDAEKMLKLFCQVYPTNIIKIDIADLDDTLMMLFANDIPVILTPQNKLCYPFSIVELQQLR